MDTQNTNIAPIPASTVDHVASMIDALSIDPKITVVKQHFIDDPRKLQTIQCFDKATHTLLSEIRFNNEGEEIFNLKKRDDGLFNIRHVSGRHIYEFVSDDSTSFYGIGESFVKTKVGEIMIERGMCDNDHKPHGNQITYDTTGSIISTALYEHGQCVNCITYGDIRDGKRPILYKSNNNADGIRVSTYHLGSMDVSRIIGKDKSCTYSVMTNGIQDVKFTEKEFDNSDALATQYRFVVSMFE